MMIKNYNDNDDRDADSDDDDDGDDDDDDDGDELCGDSKQVELYNMHFSATCCHSG